MSRPADAIVTGFVKSPTLLALSLAPLRTLKQEGVLRNIHYVTWDSPEIDAHVAPLADIPDIHLVRVPQPQVEGTGNQRGVAYQIVSLDAALALVPDNDTIVLKSRPDFIANVDFLRRKIESFDDWSAVHPERIGAHMPKPVFRNRIWVPWADCNQPFFYEDAAFMGCKRDLKKLVTTLTPRDREILGNPDCGWFAHVVRYARVFLPRYPLFTRYLHNFHCFANDMEYRCGQLGVLPGEDFFWHMVIAHAWILHTQIHVDAGEPLELLFFSNNANKDTDWSNPKALRLSNPYNDVTGWRECTRINSALPAPQRPYARLMDDEWQRALFTGPQHDLPSAKLATLLDNIAHYRDGRLAKSEGAFYLRLEAFYREHWLERSGSPDHVAQIAGAGGQHHEAVEAHRHAG